MKGKCMDNFAYVGASDGTMLASWHRKIIRPAWTATAEKVSRIISRMCIFLIKAKTMEKLLAAYRLLFSGTPYQADTLISGLEPRSPCSEFQRRGTAFTTADYVEATARDNRNRFCIIFRDSLRRGQSCLSQPPALLLDWFAAAPRNARGM